MGSFGEVSTDVYMNSSRCVVRYLLTFQGKTENGTTSALYAVCILTHRLPSRYKGPYSYFYLTFFMDETIKRLQIT